MQLDQLLPNIKTGGLSTSGFLFGAGTSAEAGYPMMPELTRQVVGALNGPDRSLLDDVLHGAQLSYEPATGEPNIETIADHVIARSISTQQQRFHMLEARLRELVTDNILAVSNPNLDRHVAFLSALKARTFAQAACVYIFTTNYDILFELAGAEAGVVVETGFTGSVERFFDPVRFALSCGSRANTAFAEHPVLTIRLVKLHGSTSWFARDNRFFERYPNCNQRDDQRVMILPRRRKVMEALQAPYDTLFTTARGALGKECKYLVSCGYSFGDDHVNDTLLQPVLSSGKIRLFALCERETPGMHRFAPANSFKAAFSDGGIANGARNIVSTDCWKFSRFVDMF